ncbi:MAG TPA: hypothetical protein V6C50_11105 [Crinalium sp.]
MNSLTNAIDALEESNIDLTDQAIEAQPNRLQFAPQLLIQNG